MTFFTVCSPLWTTCYFPLAPGNRHLPRPARPPILLFSAAASLGGGLRTERARSLGHPTYVCRSVAAYLPLGRRRVACLRLLRLGPLSCEALPPSPAPARR